MIVLLMILWLSAAAAVAAAGLNLYGQFRQGRQSRRNVKDTHRLRKQLAERQFEQEQRGIEEMKKYNAPEAQMQRFRDAGLNPNLIYSQGNPGNVDQFAQYSPYEVDFSSRRDLFPEPGSAFQQGLSTYMDLESFGSEQKVREVEAEYRQLLRSKGLDIDKVRNEVSKLGKEAGLALQRRYESGRREELIIQQLANAVQDGRIKRATVDKLVEEMDLIELKKAYQVTANELADEGIDIGAGNVWTMLFRLIIKGKGEDWDFGPGPLGE